MNSTGISPESIKIMLYPTHHEPYVYKGKSCQILIFINFSLSENKFRLTAWIWASTYCFRVVSTCLKWRKHFLKRIPLCLLFSLKFGEFGDFHHLFYNRLLFATFVLCWLWICRTLQTSKKKIGIAEFVPENVSFILSNY